MEPLRTPSALAGDQIAPEADTRLQQMSQDIARRCGLKPFGDAAQVIFHGLQEAAAPCPDRKGEE